MLRHDNSLGLPSDPAQSESVTWSKKAWLEHYIDLYPRTVRIFVALLYQQNRGLVSFDAAEVIIVILSYSDLRVNPDQWQDHSFWRRTKKTLGKIEVWMDKAVHWAGAFDRRGRMPWFPCSTDAQALRYLDPYGGLLVPRSVSKLLHGVQLCWMIFGRPPTEFWASARLDDPEWRRKYMLPVARDFEQRVTRCEAARVEALMKAVFPTKPKGIPKVGFRKFDYHGAPKPSPDGRRYARPDFDAPPARLNDPEVCNCSPVFADDVDRLPGAGTSDNDNDTIPSRRSSLAPEGPAGSSTPIDDRQKIGRRSAAQDQDHTAGGNHSQLSEAESATERTPPAARSCTPFYRTASPGGGYPAAEDQNAEFWEAHQKTAAQATEMSKAWALVMKMVCDMPQHTERNHKAIQALSSRVDANHESVGRRLSDQGICISTQAAQLAELDNRLAQQETRLAEQAHETAQLKTLPESLPRVSGGRDPSVDELRVQVAAQGRSLTTMRGGVATVRGLCSELDGRVTVVEERQKHRDDLAQRHN
ncbi:hypothetical protein C8A01DRAFT_38889 [Parachaetomium inaequale]|uniref:Uncharacterized protein n=1 Tax=Parachaetomium inaequale TaxID=2588326 RepID=A0AAN6PAB5_9PEZI|nr:hypothetical protein C8A01DRAFT_38889 [Parachaetomium inaequale]